MREQNLSAVLNQLRGRVFNRQELLLAKQKITPAFKETLIWRYLEGLIDQGEIVRVGRDRYLVRDPKKQIKFDGPHTSRFNYLQLMLLVKYPALQYTLWESSQLQPYLPNKLDRNIIILDMDKKAMQEIYKIMAAKYPGEVVINPGNRKVQLYKQKDLIVLKRLVYYSPLANKGREQTLAVEKLIVDIYMDKMFRSQINETDMAVLYKNIFDNHHVNESTLFYYASMRGVRQQLAEFLMGPAQVKLLTEE